MESDVVDKGKLIVRNRLLKCPEEIVSGGHQQGAVFGGVFLIPSQRRVGIFLCDAIKALDQRLLLTEIVQNSKGEAKTMQSASLILGTSSLKLSFCTQGFPYRQALHPMQLYFLFSQ